MMGALDIAMQLRIMRPQCCPSGYIAMLHGNLWNPVFENFESCCLQWMFPKSACLGQMQMYIVHAWPKCVKLVVSCNNQEEPWAIKWDHPWCPDNLNLSVGTLSLEMQFYVWGSPRPSWPPPSFPYYISTTTNSNFKIRHMLHTYAQNYFPRLIKFCMNMMIMTTMMITMPGAGQCVENLGSVWS